MADNITITPANGTWSVRAGGAVLGETDRALILEEAGHPSVVYFPRNDIAMEFLDPTDNSTVCPHVGDASYFSIVTKSTTLKDAAWSYPDPKDDFADIAGHLAFHANDQVTVEQL